MVQEEIWKDIDGYEMIYQVSNFGRVKSLDRIDRLGRLKPGVILRPGMDGVGYLKVGLCKEGKQKNFYVHRLVAHAFIPNPEGLPVINHKDEDKMNNRVDNLEWCTVRYNTNYGTGIERMVQAKISKGIFDPELCGLDRKEHDRRYRQKNREQILEQKREYMRKYRRRRDKITN